MSSLEVMPTIDEMSYIEMGHALPYYNRNYFMPAVQAYDFAKNHEYTGVFRSAFRYNTYLKDYLDKSYLYSDFFLDFDNEEDIDLARRDLLFVIWKMSLDITFNLPIEAFRIYYSGKKGFHLLIPGKYFNIQPHKHLDKIFKWIAGGLYEESFNETIDLVVYERRRLWRLENTKHQDTGLYKIPLEYHEVKSLSLEEIAQLATSPRVIKYPKPIIIKQAEKQYQKEVDEMTRYFEEQKTKYKHYQVTEKRYDIENIPDYIQQLIDEGPVKNYRNETVSALTSFYLQAGLTKEDIIKEILIWNNGSLPDNEVFATINSIYDKQYTYSKERFIALANKDLSMMHRRKDKVRPFWKGDN